MFINGTLFPGKYEWRNIVRKAVFGRENDLWHPRVTNDYELVRFRQMQTSDKPCVLWIFPSNRFQLRLSRYISHLWTVSPDKDINVCHHCGRLNSDIIRCRM